jgi:cytochrome P450
MSSSSDADAAGRARPASEIPRPGLLHTLQMIATGGGGRIDMLTPLRRLHARHGDVVMQQAGAFRMVNLFGPDANRAVLLDQDRIFSAKRPWDAIMGRIFPNGLLLRDGDDHKHHRKIMHTAFTRPAIRSYAERMNPMIEAHLAEWDESPRPLLAFRAYKELTLDMAASIFVGVDLGPGTAPLNRAFEDMVAASMSRLRLRIPGLEFYRGLVGREWLSGFFRDLLPKRRASESPDMFARLCRAETEEGQRLADQEIVDHMIFLMMAAHDTTTSTLTSMTYELARNPAWQERARAESRALGAPHPSFEQLEQLEALGMVLKETIRRYPPLPVIPRVATEDFTFGGFKIPARSMVVIAPIHTHHMEEWWEDPFRFDPGRFAAGRAEYERHTHAWIPFGGGPHHCLGFRFAETQVKLVMHQLLLRYRWSVPPDYRMPVQQAPISKPRDGLPIQLEPLS